MKIQNIKVTDQTACLKHLSFEAFEFVSDFGIRISNFSQGVE